jgi:two-component system cell cycle response regulator
VLRLTVSVGVAAFPGPNITTAEDLVARADEALYRAKAEGRNRVRT